MAYVPARARASKGALRKWKAERRAGCPRLSTVGKSAEAPKAEVRRAGREAGTADPSNFQPGHSTGYQVY